MSEIKNEVIKANEEYVQNFGERENLPMPPGRRFAVLTCMDARLSPSAFAGLSEGDAHVVRNAGGRASDDAIRSLVISYKLLGTKEFFVIHHTNCGMEVFTNEVISALLESSLDTAELTEEGFRDVGTSAGSTEGKYINWLTIRDQTESILEDVERIKNHPLVPDSIPIYGYLYNVGNGRLIEIEEATKAGAATAQTKLMIPLEAAKEKPKKEEERVTEKDDGLEDERKAENNAGSESAPQKEKRPDVVIFVF